MIIKKETLKTILLQIILACCCTYAVQGVVVQDITNKWKQLFAAILLLWIIMNLLNQNSEIIRYIKSGSYFALQFIAILIYNIIVMLSSGVPVNGLGVMSIIHYISIYIVAIGLSFIFRESTIDFCFWAMIMSYTVTVTTGIFKVGIGNFVGYIFNPIATESSISFAFEVHDLTFAMGIFLLYYLFAPEKIKLKKFKIILSVIAMYIGFKRIQLLAILAAFMIIIFIGKRFRSYKSNLVVCIFIACIIGYLYIIFNGSLFSMLNEYGIDAKGRIAFFEAITKYVLFSPNYSGKYYGYTNSLLKNAHLKFLLHNDILRVYTDMGFVFLILWLFWYLFAIKNKIESISLDRSKCYVAISIYIFITYLTDNTMSYFCTQLVFTIVGITMLDRGDNLDGNQKNY